MDKLDFLAGAALLLRCWSYTPATAHSALLCAGGAGWCVRYLNRRVHRDYNCLDRG